MAQALQGRARFGAFELDPRAGELHHDGRSVILQEQQLKVLLMLIEREGEIATREEIKKKLWPNDTIVEFDFGINNTIKNLRRALGDSADDPNYIETIQAARLPADGAGGVGRGGVCGGSSVNDPPPILRRCHPERNAVESRDLQSMIPNLFPEPC